MYPYFNPPIFVVNVAEDPDCRVDANCPDYQSCVNEFCRNPCHASNPCAVGQTCQVENTLPSRTVNCLCPDGFVVGLQGECNQGLNCMLFCSTALNECHLNACLFSTFFCTDLLVEASPFCRKDNQCRSTEQCVSGTCLPVCSIEPCGANAICTAQGHRRTCRCPEGFTGNAEQRCVRSKS